GLTRCDDGRITCSQRALSYEGLLRTMRARTRSPGSAPSTNTTLPSWWAMPCPSRSSDSISRSSSLGSAMIPGADVFLPVGAIAGLERIAHQLYLGLVGGGVQLALDQAVAAIHQPGIHHVGLAIGA